MPRRRFNTVFLFQGQLFDPWTANYSMRAREYSPVLARFASTDPIGFLGGTANLYAFVNGNPLSFTDPLGLRPSHGRLHVWINGIWDDVTSIKHLQTATNVLCGVGDACLGVFGVNGDSVRGAYGVSDGADTTSTEYAMSLGATEVALAVAGGLIDSEEAYQAYEHYSDGGDTSTSGGGAASDSTSNTSSGGPSFVVTENGEAIPVPSGATGPSPAWNNKGFMFEGGSGGNGLDPRVSNVRIMDPTGLYPGGYVNYGNSS